MARAVRDSVKCIFVSMKRRRPAMWDNTKTRESIAKKLYEFHVIDDAKRNMRALFDEVARYRDIANPPKKALSK